MLVINKLSLVYFILFFIASCGRVEDYYRIPSKRLSENFNELITLATPEELQNKNVEANSYIVAFKPNVSGLPTQFASFQSEYRTHYNFIADSLYPLPEIKDLFFISAIDLRSEFTGKNEEFVLPLNFLSSIKSPSREAVASLMKVDFRDEISAKTLLQTWAKNGQIWFA